MIRFEPRVGQSADPRGLAQRLKLLGYSTVGSVENRESGELFAEATKIGLGHVAWRSHTVMVEGGVWEQLEAGDKSYHFKMLVVPLSAEFRSVRKYVMRQKNVLDALLLSLKEVRAAFMNKPRELFYLLSVARHNLVDVGVPLLVCSEATSVGELAPPQALEGLLSIFYSRPDPMGMTAMKRSYSRLEALVEA